MSTFYKQTFVSPEPIYAEVKEELSSYFTSGALDDAMFPRWTEKAIKKFRKSAYKIEVQVVSICNFTAELPCNFNSVREAWLCSSFTKLGPSIGGNDYYITDYLIDYLSDNNGDATCSNEEGGFVTVDIPACDDTFMILRKQTKRVLASFSISCLLRPATMEARSSCDSGCPNLGSTEMNSFDIRNGKMITNFEEGEVLLTYYADSTDEDGDQLVPDDYYTQDFLYKFLLYKCFQRLSNIVTDESINYVEKKKQEAKQDQVIAFVMAETEMKKQTMEDKMRSIRRSYNRHNKFDIR